MGAYVDLGCFVHLMCAWVYVDKLQCILVLHWGRQVFSQQMFNDDCVSALLPASKTKALQRIDTKALVLTTAVPSQSRKRPTTAPLTSTTKVAKVKSGGAIGKASGFSQGLFFLILRWK